MKYVNVAVFAAIENTLTYSLPDGIDAPAGARVVVPLGTKTAVGLVLSAVHGKPGFDEKKIKPVREVLDPSPVISPNLMKLGDFISDYYISPKGMVFSSMLSALYGIAPTASIKLIKPDENAAGDEKRIAEFLGGKRGKKSTLAALEDIGIKSLRKVLSAMENKGIIEITEKTGARGGRAKRAEPSRGRLTAPKKIDLNKGQRTALAAVKKAMDENIFRAFLLFGVTGSGKTEVYVQAAKEAVKKGKQAIILVPEIFLTPQVLERFVSEFPERTAVYHSGLRKNERLNEWEKMRAGRADVVVGTRSAIFAPFENTGLIVVDEEFDTSYKQDSDPRYSARDVAVMRAKIENAAVILGSATPSVETFHNAATGKYEMLALPERVSDKPMPEIEITDLKASYGKKGTHFLSEQLVREIKNALDENEQAILFLNRRGFSSFVYCNKCGYVEKCPSCDVPLVYHKQTQSMKCHYCDTSYKPKLKCPECGELLFYKGLGTQRVEDVTEKLFPGKKIARVDLDSMRETEDYYRIYNDMKDRKIDILVGTQMVAKGFDFPEVTLAGVVSIDAVLNLPDFRSEERVFQLLMQVAGRTGRGDKKGRVVIQTLNPDNHAITSVRKNDAEGFYRSQLELRKKLKYPPFYALLQVVLREKSDAAAMKLGEAAAEKIHGIIRAKGIKGAYVLGPAPAPVTKVRNMYRYSILVKAPQRKDVNAIGKEMRRFGRAGNITVVIDPASTL